MGIYSHIVRHCWKLREISGHHWYTYIHISWYWGWGGGVVRFTRPLHITNLHWYMIYSHYSPYQQTRKIIYFHWIMTKWHSPAAYVHPWLFLQYNSPGLSLKLELQHKIIITLSEPRSDQTIGVYLEKHGYCTEDLKYIVFNWSPDVSIISE